MLGKVKKWLGIEGVKVELLLPEKVKLSEGSVMGVVRFTSMKTQTVTSLKVTLLEKYSRGRKKQKLTDEYEIAKIEMNEAFQVPAGEELELEFQLPFELVKSEIDTFSAKNLLFRGLGKLAAKVYNVQSQYFVDAEATVKGVALNPFARKELQVR